MSIFKVKDLDVKLAEKLNDKDLRNLNCVSKYFLRILDEAFYKRRFDTFLNKLPKYSILPEMNMYEESWKKFYHSVVKALDPNKHSWKIELAIEEDRADILALIFRKYRHTDSSIYDWEEKERDWLDPIQLTIDKDSVKCFTYLLQFTIGYYPTSVFKKHAHKIIVSEKFQELLGKEERIRAIIASFYNGCEVCFSCLYNPRLQDRVIEEFWHIDIVPLLDCTSPSFVTFMKTLSYSDLLRYKQIAMNDDRYWLIKLFVIFSSPFRN